LPLAQHTSLFLGTSRTERKGELQGCFIPWISNKSKPFGEEGGCPSDDQGGTVPNIAPMKSRGVFKMIICLSFGIYFSNFCWKISLQQKFKQHPISLSQD